MVETLHEPCLNFKVYALFTMGLLDKIKLLTIGPGNSPHQGKDAILREGVVAFLVSSRQWLPSPLGRQTGVEWVPVKAAESEIQGSTPPPYGVALARSNVFTCKWDFYFKGLL